MDKMVWFKTIQEDTKVAFKTVDKFVKFSKIKNIVESEDKWWVAYLNPNFFFVRFMCIWW